MKLLGAIIKLLLPGPKLPLLEGTSGSNNNYFSLATIIDSVCYSQTGVTVYSTALKVQAFDKKWAGLVILHCLWGVLESIRRH